MGFLVVGGKVLVAVAALSAPFAAADRDQAARKGRRTSGIAPSALVALDESSPDIPNTKNVDDAHGVVDKKLEEVSTAITKASEEAKKAMDGAVTWKTESAKIPEIIAKVHDQTKEEIWKKLQNVAPIIGGAEKKSMVDLLQGIVADIAHQKTDADADIAQKEQAEVDKVLKELSSTASTNAKGEVTKSDGGGEDKPQVTGGLVETEEGEKHKDVAKATSSQASDQDQQKEALAALVEAAKGPNGQQVLAALQQAMAPASHKQASASGAAVQVSADGSVKQTQEEAVAPFVEIHEPVNTAASA